VDGVCTARRRDGKGGTLTDPLPEGLRLRIIADYGPVLRAVLFALDRHRAQNITEVPAGPARRDPAGEQACDGGKQQVP
jgi:hypothetical protein